MSAIDSIKRVAGLTPPTLESCQIGLSSLQSQVAALDAQIGKALDAEEPDDALLRQLRDQRQSVSDRIPRAEKLVREAEERQRAAERAERERELAGLEAKSGEAAFETQRDAFVARVVTLRTQLDDLAFELARTCDARNADQRRAAELCRALGKPAPPTVTWSVPQIGRAGNVAIRAAQKAASQDVSDIRSHILREDATLELLKSYDGHMPPRTG